MERHLVVVFLGSALGCTPTETASSPHSPPVASATPSSAPSTSASVVASAASASAPVKEPPPPTAEQLVCSDGDLPAWPAVQGALGETGSGLGMAGEGAPGGFGFGHVVHKLVGKPLGVTGVPARRIAEGVCAVSPGLKVCRLAAQKKGKLSGSLEIAIEIDGAGKVTSAKRSAGTIAAGDFVTCVEKEIATATFDKEAKGSVKWDLVVSASAQTMKLKEKDVKVDGHLPPEVVRRIVRQNFPKFRACYEPVIKKDPDAKGVVFLDYVIDAKGNPKQVKESGSTLNDATARACVTKVFVGLAYPEPESGVVKVHYGIDFNFDVE